MGTLLTTREVAELLNANEKVIYQMISQKGLPATKITGKWLFPLNQVIQWIESHTTNYPEPHSYDSLSESLLVIAGNDDPLLDRTVSLFNTHYPDCLAVLTDTRGKDGLHGLRRNTCHMALRQLVMGKGVVSICSIPAADAKSTTVMVIFCHREIGILVPRGNPRRIASLADVIRQNLRIVNHEVHTIPRRMLDQELTRMKVDGKRTNGYYNTFGGQLQAGLEIVSGRAEAGLGIRPVASTLNLDFVPIGWERHDLLIAQERFFTPQIQQFIALLGKAEFHSIALTLDGYDLSQTGRTLFQNDIPQADSKPKRLKPEEEEAVPAMACV